jgi:hypothetical protein
LAGLEGRSAAGAVAAVNLAEPDSETECAATSRFTGNFRSPYRTPR